jgi:hypothetical protein
MRGIYEASTRHPTFHLPLSCLPAPSMWQLAAIPVQAVRSEWCEFIEVWDTEDRKEEISTGVHTFSVNKCGCSDPNSETVC